MSDWIDIAKPQTNHAKQSLTIRPGKKNFCLFLTSVYTAEKIVACILFALAAYFFLSSTEKCSGGDSSIYWMLPATNIASFACTLALYAYNCYAFFHKSRTVWIAVDLLYCALDFTLLIMIVIVTSDFCDKPVHLRASILSAVASILIFISGIHLVLVYHPNSKFAASNRCGGARF